MRALAFALLLAARCAPLSAHGTHAAAPSGGREMHTCVGYARKPFDCAEGDACTRHGCEWCGPGETRCTWGDD